MSSIQLNFSTLGQLLGLTGTQTTSLPKVGIQGIPFSPPEPVPGQTLPAPIPNPGPPFDPLDANFNYLNLPRLTSRPSANLTVTVSRLEVILVQPQMDLSKYVAAFSVSFPLNGLTEGQLELTGLPANFSLTAGQQITIRQLDSIDIGRFYILDNPTLSNAQGVNSLVAAFGCELALFNDKARLRTRLYCGPLPTNVQTAAKIYAQYNGLFTRTFPAGHQLLDRSDQAFSTETPYQYLQALYAPTNQDIRCLPSGGIIAMPRPPFQPNLALSLGFQNVLEVNSQVGKQYQLQPTIKLANQYQLLGNLEPRTEVQLIVSSVPTNTKPFFHSGYTETQITSTYIGDTLIYQTKVQSGYLPSSLPISDAAYKQDPCSGSPIPTVWGLVQTETFALGYYQHASGSYLASKAETWLIGKRPRQNPDTTWGLFDGTLEYAIEEYQNTAQINTEVCSKDYIQLQTVKRREAYKVDSDFVYRLTEIEDERYTPKSANPQSGTTFEGFTQEWTLVRSVGSYSDTDNTFIIQPAVSQTQDPPSAIWIRPSSRVGIIFDQLTDALIPPSAEFSLPPAIEASFCYNLTQLRVYGNRWLRENNGLAQAIEIQVPYWLQVNLGDSIWYTNSLGQTHGYLVFNISITQNGPDSQKTLLLARAT